jgi:hypothetical protein
MWGGRMLLVRLFSKTRFVPLARANVTNLTTDSFLEISIVPLSGISCLCLISFTCSVHWENVAVTAQDQTFAGISSRARRGHTLGGHLKRTAAVL